MGLPQGRSCTEMARGLDNVKIHYEIMITKNGHDHFKSSWCVLHIGRFLFALFVAKG